MTNHPSRRRGYGRRRLTVPAGLRFSDLALAREPDGSVSFDAAILRRVADKNGLSIDTTALTQETTISTLIVDWYGAHTRAGGARDPVAEDLIAEARAEGDRGSHEPGRG